MFCYARLFTSLGSAVQNCLSGLTDWLTQSLFSFSWLILKANNWIAFCASWDTWSFFIAAFAIVEHVESKAAGARLFLVFFLSEMICAYSFFAQCISKLPFSVVHFWWCSPEMMIEWTIFIIFGYFLIYTYLSTDDSFSLSFLFFKFHLLHLWH